MTLSELSHQSGIPIATLEAYQREGLLPDGEDALRRLRLIGALQELGGLSLPEVKNLIDALDAPHPETPQVISGAMDALGARTPDQQAWEATPEWQATASEVDAFLDQVGWPTRPDSSARKRLIDAILTLRRLNPDLPVQALFPYVRAAGEVAQHEVAQMIDALQSDPSDALGAVLSETLLWEPVFSSLRRIAHEQLIRRVLSSAKPQKPRPEG